MSESKKRYGRRKFEGSLASLRKSKSWPEVSNATQEIAPFKGSKKARSINDIFKEYDILNEPEKHDAKYSKKENTTGNTNKEANLKFLYTNADQLINKRDDLIMRIADDEPDIMLITEVIPKCQISPITNKY